MNRCLVWLTVLLATLLAAPLAAAQAAFVPESMLVVGTDRATVVAFIHAEDPGVAAWDLEGVEDLGPVGGAATAPAESIAFSDCRRSAKTRRHSLRGDCDLRAGRVAGNRSRRTRSRSQSP